MNDAEKAWSIIRAMTDIGSRLEKEKLVAELADFDLGRFILKMTYDPMITFGLTPPAPSSGGHITFSQALVEPLLDKLATRKLTGHAAAREVAEVMEAFDADGSEILFRILSKDLKAGVAAATINTAVPGLVPVFSVMRAKAFEEKRIKSWPQIVEPKYDGYRYTFLCRDGNGGFFSRNGIRQKSCDHLVEPMIATAVAALAGENKDLWSTLSTRPHDLARYARQDLNFMVDGEMMVPGDFNETGALRRTSEQATDAYFQVFDIMSYKDFDAVGSVGKPYKERRKLVEAFVSHSVGPAISKSERYFVNSMEEIYDLYEAFRLRKLEGAMVKNPDGLYDKTKTYGWMKIKPEETEDLRVIGWFEGKEYTKLEGLFAGYLVERINPDNGEKVEVRVGGGFSAELLAALDAECKAKTAGQEPAIERGIKKRYFEGGRLIEVEFHEVTPDGSLRHPRYKRDRDDKDGELESKEAA